MKLYWSVLGVAAVISVMLVLIDIKLINSFPENELVKGLVLVSNAIVIVAVPDFIAEIVFRKKK